jgi:dolichyl-phosphate-mannose--protein O-mannosyl transferase
VTAVKNADDRNSYWQVRPNPTNSFNGIRTGEPVECGATIRLLHLATGKNLHSHSFQSPLSNNQEVSAFGENGNGDDGDNWILECDEDKWDRNEPIRLKHQVTGKYLHITGDTFGRPISGQYEVCAYGYHNSRNLWKVNEGVYIKPLEQMVNAASHDEF